jgi:hypothetical protein
LARKSGFAMAKAIEYKQEFVKAEEDLGVCGVNPARQRSSTLALL